MERKNTILLTVIAIATLLVAVVGATFAYFTATFTPENASNNNVNVTTKVLASASFDYGDAITPVENALPGYKILKKMTVKGAGDANAEKMTLELTLTPKIDEEFGSDIKYTIYKVEKDPTTKEAKGSVTCTASNPSTKVVDNNVQFYDSMECTPSGTYTEFVAQKSFTNNSATNDANDKVETIEIANIGGTTDDEYYLVIEYFNNEEANQEAQGKTFDITLSVAPKA